MKTNSFKLLQFAIILFVVAIINTGCPHSANYGTSKDSTEGNPPKIKRINSIHRNDSTEGNPPKLQNKSALHPSDSTEGNPPHNK